MAQRIFKRTWFLRVLALQPTYHDPRNTLSSEYGVVPIIEYIEDGVNKFGMYNTTEKQIYHMATNDISAYLNPMFLGKPIPSAPDSIFSYFIRTYTDSSGRAYTLDEAYSIFMKGLFKAQTITEYEEREVCFFFKDIRYKDSPMSRYTKNINIISSYTISAMEVLKNLTIVLVTTDHSNELRRYIHSEVCLVKLKGGIEGYFVGFNNMGNIRVGWPHIAMRFGNEEAALKYLEDNAYSFRNVGYEIEQIPVKAFVPKYF